jgi:hypothetical protein
MRAWLMVDVDGRSLEKLGFRDLLLCRGDGKPGEEEGGPGWASVMRFMVGANQEEEEAPRGWCGGHAGGLISTREQIL